MEGKIDGNEENFNEEKYKELCEKFDEKWCLSEDMKKEDMLYNWPELRLYEFVPKIMKLANN